MIFSKVPNILISAGVKQLPILMSPSKIRNSVLTKNEALEIWFSISKNDNYHAIGKVGINNALDRLYNPDLIIKENENKIIIFTDCFDYMERQIIIPIEINTKSYLNNKEINANVILSIHGRKNVANFIQKLLNKKAKIIYKKHRTLLTIARYHTLKLSVLHLHIIYHKTNLSQLIYLKNYFCLHKYIY